MQICNISAYKFIALHDLPELREELIHSCQQFALKGTILLAEEGINLMLSGKETAVMQWLVLLQQDHRFDTLEFKYSHSRHVPFAKLKVLIKSEIIRIDDASVQPGQQGVPYVTPRQLKQWYDEKRDMVVLDTRNDYEVAYGTFEQALDLNLGTFRHFAEASGRLTIDKTKPIVTFCTGGVRCEKAGIILLRQGFTEVYQLQGGILNYFKQCSGAYYHGSCFVFDHRLALTVDLQAVVDV